MIPAPLRGRDDSSGAFASANLVRGKPGPPPNRVGDSGLHDVTPRGWGREQVGQLVTLGHSFVPNLVVIVLTILR